MSDLKIEYLIGVYQYFNPNPEEEIGASYYLLYLLDQRGILEKEDAKKLYQESHTSFDLKSKYIGPFESVDNINQFAFLLCEKLDAQKISLLSAQEYNGLLEHTQQASDFHRDLLLKGNVIDNIDKKEKGFFKKLFR
jgi:hypothetical protein